MWHNQDRIEQFMHRRKDAAWNESDHPRDNDGKFTAGAGGGGAKLSESLKPDPTKYNKQRAEYIKKKLAEVEAALAANDPVAALKAIEVKSGHGKTKAYIDQLVKEHEDEMQANAPPSNDEPDTSTYTPLTASKVGEMSNADKEDWGMSIAELYNSGDIDADMMESELDKLGMVPKHAGPGKYTAEWPENVSVFENDDEDDDEDDDESNEDNEPDGVDLGVEPEVAVKSYVSSFEEGLMSEASLKKKAGDLGYKIDIVNGHAVVSGDEDPDDLSGSEKPKSLAEQFPSLVGTDYSIGFEKWEKDYPDGNYPKKLLNYLKASVDYKQKKIKFADWDTASQQWQDSLSEKPTPLTPFYPGDKAKIESYYGSMLPANKALVEPKMNEIAEAMASGDVTKLAAVQPIPSNGAKSVTETNKYLQNLKNAHNVGGSQYNLNSVAKEQAVKAAVSQIKAAPHKKIVQTSVGEGAGGKEIEAKLHVDTKTIPHGFYDKATAALAAANGNASASAFTQTMQEYHDLIWPKMPAKMSLKAYQGSSFASINKGLAKPPPGESAKSHIKAIDQAMATARTPADMPVFRGIRSSLKDVTGFDDPEEAVGRCFEHSAYASVSRDENVSKSFGGSGYTEGVMLKFNLPAGSPGVVMPKQGWEKEILLDRNSVFRIDKHEKVGQAHVLHVTYLGHNKSETLDG